MKFLVIIIFSMALPLAQAQSQSLAGAWEHREESSTESRIYAGDFFAVSIYNQESKTFVGTFGGKFAFSGNQLTETIEFDTRNPERIGTDVKSTLKLAGKSDSFTLLGNTFSRVDNGTPGQLAGAWLITGRVNDKGEIRRSTPGARRTMKILSGTRFQWIAYNVETKEFFGTGGGTYTTVDGKYTETIAFFSRDNSRVGVSLGFDYVLQEGEWHHSGLSSKGEPIHEVWTQREKIGL